jgi:transcriptional regulator with XRE-family HTH domain
MVDGKKLSKLLKKKKIKSEDLLVRLKDYGINLSLSSIKQYRIGIIAIPVTTIEAIAHILDCSELDLLENSKEKKEKVVLDELKNNLDTYIKYLPNTAPIPQSIKKVTFNHGYPSSNKIIMENDMQNAEHIYIDKITLPLEYQEKELKAVAIMGTAMQPCMNHGDVAIYYPVTEYQGKSKYVINSADGLEVTNIEKLKKCKSLVLKPSNPIFTTETFSTKEQDLIEFVGIVVSTIARP